MAREDFLSQKPKINLGVIGAEGHGKTTLQQAIQAVLVHRPRRAKAAQEWAKIPDEVWEAAFEEDRRIVELLKKANIRNREVRTPDEVMHTLCFQSAEQVFKSLGQVELKVDVFLGERSQELRDQYYAHIASEQLQLLDAMTEHGIEFQGRCYPRCVALKVDLQGLEYLLSSSLVKGIWIDPPDREGPL